MAKEDKLPVVVSSSPMGALLYTHVGFRSLGRTHVQIPGETESYGSEMMVFDTHKQPSIGCDVQGARTRCAIPSMD